MDHFPASKVILCNAASGAAAGVIAAAFVCPLDVIKTRFQVHGLPQLPNGSVKGSLIVGSLEQIFHKEGFRGMYRGLASTVLALLPNWAVYFTMYEQFKSLLSSDDEHHHLSIGANMLDASGAGAATTIATNPLWVVKTRLQCRRQPMDTNLCGFYVLRHMINIIFEGRTEFAQKMFDQVDPFAEEDIEYISQVLE